MINVITRVKPKEICLNDLKQQLGAITIIEVELLEPDDLEFMDFIMQDNSIFLSVICSGYGSTAFEPNNPKSVVIKEAVSILLQKGFPASQLILNLSPLVRNQKGLRKAEEILELFRNSGVYKVKLSKLSQSHEQKQLMHRKFGSSINEDPRLDVNALIIKFPDYVFYWCECEEPTCNCVPTPLSIMLQGCSSNACKHDRCNVINATIVDLETKTNRLYYN